ncbi:NYN domain-containing protein, partial [Hymenobacter agri]
MTPKSPASPYAAVFIDFENVYYFLKNHFHDPPDLNDICLDIVRSLREKLSATGLDSLISYAYADFERLATAPQGALYLMGVSTRNVLGTDHKNAADMQLCIDALEVMYTRPDIGTFVLVAGDRDYIPVLQHLRRQARQVLVAGFRESVSGDLLQNIGAAQFIDARDLLAPARVEQLE